MYLYIVRCTMYLYKVLVRGMWYAHSLCHVVYTRRSKSNVNYIDLSLPTYTQHVICTAMYHVQAWVQGTRCTLIVPCTRYIVPRPRYEYLWRNSGHNISYLYKSNFALVHILVHTCTMYICT